MRSATAARPNSCGQYGPYFATFERSAGRRAGAAHLALERIRVSQRWVQDLNELRTRPGLVRRPSGAPTARAANGKTGTAVCPPVSSSARSSWGRRCYPHPQRHVCDLSLVPLPRRATTTTTHLPHNQLCTTMIARSAVLAPVVAGGCRAAGGWLLAPCTGGVAMGVLGRCR